MVHLYVYCVSHILSQSHVALRIMTKYDSAAIPHNYIMYYSMDMCYLTINACSIKFTLNSILQTYVLILYITIKSKIANKYCW